MRNSLRLVLALGAASAFGAALLLACSDDTSVNASTEAGTPVPDAAFDSPPESDAGFDAADTAPPFDGGFVIESFDSVLGTELCKSLARCCYGTDMPAEGGADGGTFDLNACVAAAVQFGFQGSNLGTAELRDAGNIVLDQVAADDCINKVKAIKCDLPGPDYTAARMACFGVYTGKFDVGHACKAAGECKRGLYCKGEFDGGPGACAAVEALGGPCGLNPDHPTEYEEACSYRASGDTGRFCKFYDFAGGGTDLDAGDWKCTAAGGAAASCATSTWCTDTICDPNTSICKTPDRLFDEQCASYLKP